MNMTPWFRHIIIYFFAALPLPAYANSTQPIFQEGYWTGQAVPQDPQAGCHMFMQLDEDTTLSIYANNKGRFDLAFRSPNWNIDDQNTINAELEINGQPITFTRVFFYDPKVVLIRGTTVEDSRKLETLIRQATFLRVAFQTPDYFAQTTFFDNHLAVTALKNCIKNQQREQTKN